MKQKKSFLIYENWAILIANLPVQQAGELIKAICAMQTGSEYTIQDPTVSAMYQMILPKMQEDAEAYAETRQKRSDAAKKKWSSAQPDVTMQMDTDAMQNDANASKCSAKACKTMQMDGDTDTVTDTDTTKEKKENIKETKENPLDESEPPAAGLEISDFPFNTFWSMYAKYKQSGEKYAMSAFANAAISTDTEVIISGLKKVIDLQWSKWPKGKYQYIPSAANWLKGEHWKDRVEPFVPNARDRQEVLPAYYTRPKNTDPNDPRNKPLPPEKLKEMQEKLKRLEEEHNR